MAYAINNYVGSTVLVTYGDYFRLQQRLLKKQMNYTIDQFFRKGGVSPSAIRIPLTEGKITNNKANKILKFVPNHEWSKNAIVETGLDFTAFIRQLKLSGTEYRTFI